MTDVTIPSLFGSASMTHHDGRRPGRNGRKTEKIPLERYSTPHWMTGHLLDRLDLNVQPGQWPACRCDGADILESHRPTDPPGIWVPGPRHALGCPGLRPPRILECCAGDGAIVTVIRERYPESWIQTNDVDRKLATDLHFDATKPWPTEVGWPGRTQRLGFDWVITNPPFSKALAILRNAIEAAEVGVAMLLRITWLEPPKGPGPAKARATFLAESPPKWELVMERWDFDGSGKQDSATTAWFVWSKHLGFRIEVIPGKGIQGGFESMLESSI